MQLHTDHKLVTAKTRLTEIKSKSGEKHKEIKIET